MKTRTIRLVEFMIYGTHTSMCVALMYRGKVVMEFTGHKADKGALHVKALRWARNQGFTHYQLGEDTLKRNTLIQENVK